MPPDAPLKMILPRRREQTHLSDLEALATCTFHPSVPKTPLFAYTN